MSNDIESALDDIIEQTRAILEGQDDYFQEASARYLIRGLCWMLVRGNITVDEDELANHFETMATVLREDDRSDLWPGCPPVSVS